MDKNNTNTNTLSITEAQALQSLCNIGQPPQPQPIDTSAGAGDLAPITTPQQPVKRGRGRYKDDTPLNGLKALAAVIARDNDPDKDYDDPNLDKLWDDKGVWIGLYPQEHRAYRLELFIRHYIANGYNAPKAAVSSGYCHGTESRDRIFAAGAMLRKSLRKQIRARVANVALTLGITAEKVMREMASLAFSNIGDYLSAGGYGAVTDISSLPREALAAVKEITVDQIFEGRGENKQYTGDRVKLKLHDKFEVLKLLAGHIKAIDVKPDTVINAGQIQPTIILYGDSKEVGQIRESSASAGVKQVESREVIPQEDNK